MEIQQAITLLRCCILIGIHRYTKMKHICEAVEKILRQLESQKDNIDQQRFIVQQILSKFPTAVIVKLKELKQLNDAGPLLHCKSL